MKFTLPLCVALAAATVNALPHALDDSLVQQLATLQDQMLVVPQDTSRNQQIQQQMMDLIAQGQQRPTGGPQQRRRRRNAAPQDNSLVEKLAVLQTHLQAVAFDAAKAQEVQKQMRDLMVQYQNQPGGPTAGKLNKAVMSDVETERIPDGTTNKAVMTDVENEAKDAGTMNKAVISHAAKEGEDIGAGEIKTTGGDAEANSVASATAAPLTRRNAPKKDAPKPPVAKQAAPAPKQQAHAPKQQAPAPPKQAPAPPKTDSPPPPKQAPAPPNKDSPPPPKQEAPKPPAGNKPVSPPAAQPAAPAAPPAAPTVQQQQQAMIDQQNAIIAKHNADNEAYQARMKELNPGAGVREMTVQAGVVVGHNGEIVNAAPVVTIGGPD